MPDSWRVALRAARESGPAGDAVQGIAPLVDRAWLRVSGHDAGDFLHDQVSADLKGLDDQRMQPAAYCSPQGRVLAVPRFLRDGDDWLLELPSALREGFARRLQLFVLRADVRLRPEESMGTVGLWGDAAPRLLSDRDLAVPGEAFACRRADPGLRVIRMPGSPPRFQLTGPGDEVLAWFRSLSRQLPAADAEFWRLLDIGAGLADVGPATADRHLPQSLALEQWDIVNYRKGCYPGQEVVARLHYRGRLKRRLYRAHVPGPPPAPGTGVVDAEGASVGEIIVSAKAEDGGTSRVLVVLRESAVGTRCRLGDARGPQLQDPAPVESG